MMAFDGSASRRRVDSNGFMHVESPFTKEAVNEYWGYEIPGWEALGLDPARLYRGYRPAEELERAAGTFNGLPLLLEHYPVDSHTPQKEHLVGSLGSSARFERPYLYNVLSITDADGIEAVESERYRQLSAAYSFEPEFTPGAFDGELYDFIMRNIKGNHVALVEEGRAGPDVAVADAQTVKAVKEERSMSVVNALLEGLKNLVGVAQQAQAQEAVEGEAPAEGVVTPPPVPNEEPQKEAQAGQEGAPPPEEKQADQDPGAEALAWLDAQPDQEGAAKVRALIASLLPPAPTDSDPEEAKPADDEPEAKAGDGEEGPPKAQDVAKDSRLMSRLRARLAFDAAGIRRGQESVKAQIRRELTRELQDKVSAADAVRPLTGPLQALAFDSAADIYVYALARDGFKATTRDAAALKDLALMRVKAREAKAAPPSKAGGLLGRFPGLSRIN
jgi:hypothetical protein